MNTENKEKKIIGVQVNDDLYQALLEVAAENGTSVSGAIRMIALDYLKRYKNFNVNKKGNVN